MEYEKAKRLEVDLYEPIQQYLTTQGYNVHGEVNDCDVAAVKGEELVIVELKLTLNVDLLIQAAKRQRVTEQVYVAIPKPKYSLRSRKWQDICYLMRRLELGLIIVSFQEEHTTMDVIHHPGPFDRIRSMRQSKRTRNKMFAEIAGRHADYNVGGSAGSKIMTAYKENCIHIACCLEQFGPLSPKSLRDMGTGDKTLSILNNNFYGWFNRVERGIYTLSETGLKEFKENPQIVEHYYKLIRDSSE